MEVQVQLLLGQQLQLLPLEVCGLLVPGARGGQATDEMMAEHPNKQAEQGQREQVHSQLHDDGPRLDLVHFHEGETFCAGELLLGFVVLEFKEDGRSWKNAHASYSQDGGCELRG